MSEVPTIWQLDLRVGDRVMLRVPEDLPKVKLMERSGGMAANSKKGSKGLVAPKGECAYCDRRRAYVRNRMRLGRKAKKEGGGQ
jgi:hypothetical protein